MAIACVPEVLLRAPDLMVPGKGPAALVRPDWSHPLLKNSLDVIFFNVVDNNLAQHARWAYGTAVWPAQIIAGEKCYGRADIDEDGGYFFQQSAHGRTSSADPFYVLLSFCLLAAPSAATKGLFCIGSSSTDGSAEVLVNSQDTSNLRLYINGNYQITDIPVVVGSWQQMAIQYSPAGGKWSVYSSVTGQQHNYGSTAHANFSTTDRLWAGSGYNAQLPAGWRILVHGIGELPDDIFKSWVKDPWQIALPA